MGSQPGGGVKHLKGSAEKRSPTTCLEKKIRASRDLPPPPPHPPPRREAVGRSPHGRGRGRRHRYEHLTPNLVQFQPVRADLLPAVDQFCFVLELHKIVFTAGGRCAAPPRLDCSAGVCHRYCLQTTCCCCCCCCGGGGGGGGGERHTQITTRHP